MKKSTIILSILIVSSVLVYGKFFYCSGSEEVKDENYKLHDIPGFEFPLKAYDWDNYRRQSVLTGKVKPGGVFKGLQELVKRGLLAETVLRRNRTAGEGWEPVNDFFATLSITRMTFDPLNPMHYYFCTGEGWGNADAVRGAGVWRSTDAGTTWAQIPSTDSTIFYQCQDMKIHPTTGDIYVATRQDGLQRSDDGGATWEKVLGAGIAGGAVNSICDIELTQNGGIFATTGIFETGGIYYSDNGDSGTWVRQTTGFPTSGLYRVEIATAPSNDSVAYAIPVATNFRIEGVYVTYDKGNRWISMPTPGGDDRLAASQGWYDLTLAVDPNNADVVVAGGLNLFRSQDGALNWQQITQGRPDTLLVKYVHVDQHEIYFQSSDTVLFGNDGGLWKCDNFTDAIPNIYSINYGYNVTQFYAADIHPTNGVTFVGGTQDNGSYMSTAPGFAEFQRVSGADGSWCFINYDEPLIAYTSTQYKRMYRFKSGGLFELPDTITNNYIDNSDVQFINPFAMDGNDPDVLYQASSKGVWKLDSASTATSDDWEKITRNAGTLTAISSSVHPPNKVFVGKRSGSADIFRIDDADFVTDPYTPINIDPLNQLPDVIGFFYDCSSIFVNPNDANHLVVTYTNYDANSIWECKNALDGTPTWESIEGDLINIPVNWAVLHPEDSLVCYIGTDLGVFRTEKIDGDSTKWIPTNTGLANVRIDMLRVSRDGKTMLAATHGRGIFTAPIGTSTDLVWEERGPSNYGGRTRTIMLDPNDATKSIYWAGSVSGGLWRTGSLIGLNTPKDIKTQTDVKVYPNPFGASGVTVENVDAGDGEYIIYNLDGKIMHRNTFSSSDAYVRWVPNRGAPAGIYLMQISSGDKSNIVKLVYSGR